MFIKLQDTLVDIYIDGAITSATVCIHQLNNSRPPPLEHDQPGSTEASQYRKQSQRKPHFSYRLQKTHINVEKWKIARGCMHYYMAQNRAGAVRCNSVSDIHQLTNQSINDSAKCEKYVIDNIQPRQQSLSYLHPQHALVTAAHDLISPQH